jgi:hypothetical protein
LLLEVMNTFEVLEFKKHKCRECDWETIENSKGKGNIKEWT